MRRRLLAYSSSNVISSSLFLPQKMPEGASSAIALVRNVLYLDFLELGTSHILDSMKEMTSKF
jgi:hypothetical protein